MKSLNLSNITLVAIIVLVIYIVYDTSCDNAFKRKLNIIEARRDSLQRAMQDLLAKSEARDKQLKGLVAQNLKYIELLNDALNKKSRISQDIQDDIKKNVHKIDSLWLVRF